MPGWYSSFNPYQNVNQGQVDTLFDTQMGGPGTSQSDWWSYDPEGIDAGNGTQGWYKRLGRTVSDALGGSGYYTDASSQMALGQNLATMIDLARTQAAAQGNIGTSNPDMVKNYLKQNLQKFLTTGSLGSALGVGGPNSTGSNYRDTFGQINTNAAAGTPEQQNWYKGNSASIERGLQAMTNLQTGGGLRSSVSNTISDIFDRANANHGRFWQDQSGGTFNPWGGSFASNLPAGAQTVTPNPAAGGEVLPPAGGTGTTDQHPVDPGAGQHPVTPPVIADPGLVHNGGGGLAPANPGPPPGVAPGDYMPPNMPSGPIDTTYPSLDYNQTIDQLWMQLFGRPATGSERSQWADRLQRDYGGDINWMVENLKNSAPARRYAQTGVAAPAVASPEDRAGARAFAEWLGQQGDVERFIDDYLRDLGRVSRY